ncbi:DUF1932 domain-containing protein [Planotetraspora sp. GP83]|uniref:DUF1932 domain-containing protein n=1 Tax=Planotetraspora sp. GP83 TaxID=3156264 RepID=UPI0035120D2C
MNVAILHPGQMGAAIAAQARRSGARLLWCPEGRSAASAHRAEAAGLEPVDDLGEALAVAEVAIAVCPPAAAEDLAVQVAGTGFDGVYVEANAISPQRFQRIAALLTAAVVIDGSIIGPPPGPAAGARLYLAGPTEDVKTVSHLFTGTAVQVVDLGEQTGRASALKMAFASFQKVTRTLTGISYALAEQYGLAGELRAEATRMGGSPLADPDYLPSVAARAWRWAPEMREAAEALRGARLPDDMVMAAEAVLNRWAADKDNFDLDYTTVLDHLRDDQQPRG